MERRPLFWVILGIIFIAGMLFSYYYFPKAMPFLNLNINMDRKSALKSANEIAKKYNLKPDNYSQSVVFEGDNATQNFIELEGGGTSELTKLLSSSLYSPYQWRVRHFKEKEVFESTISFTPQGKPYNFIMKVPEKEKGEFISSDSAYILASNFATKEWQINMKDYKLIENSQEKRPSGRVDYSIVFEHQKEKIGEGRFRLKIVISGGNVTELTHILKVPESFERRYEEMRSSNTTIASVGMVLMFLLYICFGIVGLFFLIREKRVIWKQPLLWGSIIGLLSFFSQLNSLKLLWMDYDTALSASSFLTNTIMRLLFSSIVDTILVTLSIIIAENLARKAFPEHIQFWKLWSKDARSSKSVIGQTIGGYLWVGFELSFIIAFYFFASKVLGWWSPAETAMDPNVLAEFVPWLSPIANAFHAGFWEECLFRAIPLAGAALLGNKYGNRKAWIIGALIIQALIFGSAHATYPNQPSYARVIEMIIPFILFGIIYLRYGLLPVIIIHFTYDAILMSIPLFVSSAKGIWFDITMVTILTLLPLIIVLIAYIRNRKATEVPKNLLNSGWEPLPGKSISEQYEETDKISIRKTSNSVLYSLYIIGIAGIILFFTPSNIRNDSPSIQITRAKAEQIAKNTVTEHGFKSAPEWKVFSKIQNYMTDENKLVWRNTNRENYKNYYNSFLFPPTWFVRFAKFDGDISERTEEWNVYIDGQGMVRSFSHKLPEVRSGKSLSKDETRIIVYNELKKIFNQEPAKLKEVSAVEKKMPNRTDWVFEFADTINYRLKTGEGRYYIQISGDKLTEYYAYLYVPEDFTRIENSRETVLKSIKSILMIIVILILISGLILGIVMWSRKQFDVKSFLIFSSVLIALGIIHFINGLKAMPIYFPTSEPYITKYIMTGLGSVLWLLALALIIGIFAGFLKKWVKFSSDYSTGRTIINGISSAMILSGTFTILNLLKPALEPKIPDLAEASATLTFLNGIDILSKYILISVIVLFLISAVTNISKSWTKNRTLSIGLLILLGFILSSFSILTISFWIISGIVLSAVLIALYIFILRYNLAIVPSLVGTNYILNLIQQIINNDYSGVVMSSALTILIIIIVIYLWTKSLLARLN
jgi:membrane protease YdiL (CAAX protease family)